MNNPLRIRSLVLAMAVTVIVAGPADSRLAFAQQEGKSPDNTAAARPTWYGTMTAGGRDFRFIIEAEGESDEVHFLRSLDEGNRRFRLDDFQVGDSQEDGQLSFELKLTDAKYSGKLTDDGTTADGTWQQRGAELELDFHRATDTPFENPDEVWEGTLNALVQKLDLRFRIYEQADNGMPRVRFDSVSQRAGGFHATLKKDGESWTFEVPALKARYEAKLEPGESGDQLTGSWKQGLLPLSLTMKKAENPQLASEPPPVARPQTPQPPFPYRVQEVTIPNKEDDVTLSGTITIPEGDGPFPAAVLISGSGPQDRDETLLEHKPFAVLADHLTRNGIAVLRYDDRGFGKSTGNFQEATSEAFSRDAEAAFAFLQTYPSIAPHQVGLIGHSEGGLVAPMVAARNDQVAWIVLLAGTGVTGREILLSQGQLVLRAEGVTDELALKTQRVVQEAVFGALPESTDESLADDLVERASETAREQLTSEQISDEQLKQVLQAAIQQIQAPWFRFFLKFDPTTVLRQVSCPVLVLNGEKDTQVDPELNVPAIEQALREGKDPPFETTVFAGLNHLFQTARTGAVSEYAQIEETMAPVVLERVVEWIKKQTG